MNKQKRKSLIFFRTLLWIGMLCLLAALVVTVFSLATTNKSLKKQIETLQQTVTENEDAIRQLESDLSAKRQAEEEKLASYIREEVPDAKQTSHKAYQDIYPDLYATRPDEWIIRANTVFLTFDDGPTPYTAEVLDVLKEKGVKGTFFVVGRYDEEYRALMRRIVEDGHTIAVHTNSHDYKTVYASVDAFLTDFYLVHDLIYQATGVRADIFRFPGGSKNSYNKSNHREISDEMIRRGFTYYDWNASTGDSSSKITAESAYQNAVSKAGREDRIILLMHDTKEASVNALPRIIDTYREKGYDFAALTNQDKPMAYNL